MMKKFLKLCNCKKATTIESANYRSSQQNDTRIDDEQIREEEIEQTFAHKQIEQNQEKHGNSEIAQFLQEQIEIKEEIEHYTEIEDLKIANRLHRHIKNLYLTRHNELLEQEMKDAKLAMETQDFEYANMFSELQTVQPKDKIEYLDRNKLFLNKSGIEIKIQKIPAPTKTQEPKLGVPDHYDLKREINFVQFIAA